jgi:hypothetical protein
MTQRPGRRFGLVGLSRLNCTEEISLVGHSNTVRLARRSP